MTTTVILLKIKSGRKAEAEALVRDVAPTLDEVYARAGARRWMKYTYQDLWIEFIDHSGTTEQLLDAVTQDPEHQRLAPRFGAVIELEESSPDGIFATEVYRLEVETESA